MLPRLLARTDDSAVCLVQPKDRALAEGRLERSGLAHPTVGGRLLHPSAEYDTSNTTPDLAGSGIAPPRLRDYAQQLVAFARAHPEIGSAAMV